MAESKTMAMRLVEDHSVALVSTASAVAVGASGLAVQWIGEGGAIVTGVGALGSIVAICFAWVRANRGAFEAQVASQARSFELTVAQLRADNQALRADLEDARAEIASLRKLIDH